MRIERAGNQNHVTATADSTGVVAVLYRVQDRFESYFDAKTLCSSKLVKHTEEGSHRRETVITYDYARGKSVLDEHNLKDQSAEESRERHSRLRDRRGLGNSLRRAACPCRSGATYTFPLNDGGKTVTVQANVEGKEQIKTPAGTFQTVRVGSGGQFRRAEESRPHLDLVHRRRPASCRCRCGPSCSGER